MIFLIRKWLPNFIKIPLWGDRVRWGLSVIPDDTCWKKWQKIYTRFYKENQRGKLGQWVNDAGYKVMNNVDLTGKKILEIGPGDLTHLQYMHGIPKEYVIADISKEMMTIAQQSLKKKGVAHKCILLKRNQKLPIQDNYFDIIINFYSLEHLYPIEPYLFEIKRVLKPKGLLIGAIPAEGGLSWGLGRALTSRRWLQKNSNINPDKIICWEHPNFADDILYSLNKIFTRKKIKMWPFPFLPLLDINLVIQLVYTKPEK